MKHDGLNCDAKECEFYDEKMELNCSYSEDNSKCVWNTRIDPVKAQMLEVLRHGLKLGPANLCCASVCQDYINEIRQAIEAAEKESL